MRARLAALLFIPTLLILLVLGAAYVGSDGRQRQQDVVLDRLRDVNYLSELAIQSLTRDDPDVVAQDLDRYRDVYGIGAAVLDRGGATWATNGLDPHALPERHAALAGQRSEPAGGLFPWDLDHVVLAEPLFKDGDLLGAVVTSSDTTYLSHNIGRNWAFLGIATILTSVLALLISARTAGWVLRPVRAVEGAMSAIGQGQLEARIPESTGPPELIAVVARFNAMAAQVELLMRRQQEFVSNAAHELRNPLNALMLRVEDLSLTVPADQATETAMVRHEALRMAHVLDALLMLAEDTPPEVDDEPVDIQAIVESRAASWVLLSPGRVITVRPPARKDLWAEMNHTVLESSLDVVLDNALKFSPDDTEVEVHTSAEGGMVQIQVRDYGSGVSPEELDRLTERFWRSPRHRGVVHGSGLGLSICSELLQLSGGSLRFSLPDSGGLLVTLQVPTWRENDR